MAEHQIVIAGFGGQGLLFSGKVLAYAGLMGPPLICVAFGCFFNIEWCQSNQRFSVDSRGESAPLRMRLEFRASDN